MKRLLLLLAMALPFAVLAQKKKQSDQPATPAPTVSFASKIKDLKKYEGFFEFYYDEKQDKIFLVIDKLNTEFLYVESLTAAVGSNDIGLDRNQLGRERVVRLERRGPK